MISKVGYLDSLFIFWKDKTSEHDQQVYQTCLKIIEYLNFENPTIHRHLSLASILNKLENSHIDTVQEALNFLSGTDIKNLRKPLESQHRPILTLKIEFIDNIESFDISIDEYLEVLETNEFYHPDYGVLVKNWRERIQFYYLLTL